MLYTLNFLHYFIIIYFIIFYEFFVYKILLVLFSWYVACTRCAWVSLQTPVEANTNTGQFIHRQHVSVPLHKLSGSCQTSDGVSASSDIRQEQHLDGCKMAKVCTSVQHSVVPPSSGADGVKFDEAAVGRGGAGFLWELHLDERQLTRTSLARPPPWTAGDDDSSDEASVTTIEDISSDANEPTEGIAEVNPCTSKGVLPL